MINTLSSEDLWVVGASAVLATGVALAVVACGKYARGLRANPKISDVAQKTLTSSVSVKKNAEQSFLQRDEKSAIATPSPRRNLLSELMNEIPSQEEEEQGLLSSKFRNFLELQLGEDVEELGAETEWNRYRTSHENMSLTALPFSSEPKEMATSLLLNDFRPQKRILGVAKSSLSLHQNPVSYKRADLPSRISLNERERAILYGKELEKSKSIKSKSMVLEEKLITLPSGAEVRGREIVNKKDSFYLSYAVCLWKEISKSKNSEFLLDAIRNNPMFLGTTSECERLKIFARNIKNPPNFQSNYMMHTWVMYLRNLAGTALENCEDRVAVYERVVKELHSLEECGDLHPKFNDEDFEYLVRKVRYGDIPGTPTIIQALTMTLGNSVTVLQDDPQYGLRALSRPTDLPVASKLLHHEGCYIPIDFSVVVTKLEDNSFSIKTNRPNMTFFAGYATAILYACMGNAYRVEQLKTHSNLSSECITVLESVAELGEQQSFEEILQNPLMLQTLVKGLKALWESVSIDRSLERIDPVSLQAFMNEIKMNIRIKQQDELISNPLIAFGNLVLQPENEAIYQPLSCS